MLDRKIFTEKGHKPIVMKMIIYLLTGTMYGCNGLLRSCDSTLVRLV